MKSNETITVLCYKKCTTCQKALKWLDEQGIAYAERPIKEENPSAEELKSWYEKSGLPLKRFFNTSGMLYKELALKDRLPQMTEEEQLALLATDGMLVKRPLVVAGDVVLTGFKEAEWRERLLG
ncbi:MAG: arsenate reductase family protein [Lachnospiraceae bacterium]|nr:arsenate reductase family protein [Lachnospiraceae bacterium]